MGAPNIEKSNPAVDFLSRLSSKSALVNNWIWY